MWRFIVINMSMWRFIVISIVNVAFYCHQHCQCGVLLSSTLSSTLSKWRFIVAFYCRQHCQCGVSLASTLSMWRFIIINVVNVSFYCHQNCHQHCQCGFFLSSTLSMWRFVINIVINIVNVAFYCGVLLSSTLSMWRFVNKRAFCEYFSFPQSHLRGPFFSSTQDRHGMQHHLRVFVNMQGWPEPYIYRVYTMLLA
jgi:hypothetical protein